MVAKIQVFIVVRKQLGIKVITNSFPSSHIGKMLEDYFSTIGKKKCSKNRNVYRPIVTSNCKQEHKKSSFDEAYIQTCEVECQDTM